MINISEYSSQDQVEIEKLVKEAMRYDGRFEYKEKQYVARNAGLGKIEIYLLEKRNKQGCCNNQNEQNLLKKQVKFSPEEEKQFAKKVDQMIKKNQNGFVFKNFIFNYYVKNGQLTFRGVPIIKEDPSVVNA